MNEFVELADWFGWRSPHEPAVVDSLPTPTFKANGVQRISFSTNNYLGIANSPRMKAAAIRGIEAYGVGNSDSRLLGGNLALYGELERKIARSNGKSHALLFATGYSDQYRRSVHAAARDADRPRLRIFPQPGLLVCIFQRRV